MHSDTYWYFLALCSSYIFLLSRIRISQAVLVLLWGYSDIFLSMKPSEFDSFTCIDEQIPTTLSFLKELWK